MRTSPDDIAADLATLAEMIAEADERVSEASLELAAASEVYDRLIQWRNKLDQLVEFHRAGTDLLCAAREHVRRIADLDF